MTEAEQAAADRRWLAQAIELSRCCPPSATAFSVGAVLVSAESRVIATGYSRESDPKDHAEEVALARAADQGIGCAADSRRAADPSLGGVTVSGTTVAEATLYSSLEPCLRRASRPRPCAELILAAGVRRVVVAWLEPPVFMPGGGAAWLREHGVTVIELPELAESARAVNAHLLRR
jgi:pyrimidine deaminase RibD-like protein